MGKRIIAQRRGRGTSTYRAHSHRHIAPVKMLQVEGTVKGTVKDLLNDIGKNPPLAFIKLEDGREMFVPAYEGMKVGDVISIGDNVDIRAGNITAVSNIPEGTFVYNVELKPYDGGKIVRASGGYAIIISHDEDKTIIKLPSRRFKSLNPNCRAIIGIAAGGDRKQKPFVKAGNKWKAMHARGKLYPITSKTAMNAVDHKFGGSNFGTSKTSSKHAPPGRKVGSIGARRTGKKK